jgi:hypothetical protein
MPETEIYLELEEVAPEIFFDTAYHFQPYFYFSHSVLIIKNNQNGNY